MDEPKSFCFRGSEFTLTQRVASSKITNYIISSYTSIDKVSLFEFLAKINGNGTVETVAFHYSLQATTTLSSRSCNNTQEDTGTARGDLNINHFRAYYLATLLRTKTSYILGSQREWGPVESWGTTYWLWLAEFSAIKFGKRKRDRQRPGERGRAEESQNKIREEERRQGSNGVWLPTGVDRTEGHKRHGICRVPRHYVTRFSSLCILRPPAGVFARSCSVVHSHHGDRAS